MTRFIPSRTRCSEQGYVLLTLMLFSAVLAITALAILPEVAQQAKRDREEELIHRGVQYSRAIKKYVKKFGNYPTSLEALDNTNQIRFLRKRYKDPVTGKDFKLLHMGDVQMSFGAGIAGAVAPGQLNQSGFGGNRLTGQASPGQLGNGPPNFGLPNSPPNAQNQQQQGGGDQNAQGQGQGQDQGDQANSDEKKDQQGDSLSGKTFGGGPIVGVVSTSKDETIREFNKKNHYNQWQFIYDPSTDRGGLLTTPNQPPLQGAGTQQPGQAGQPGQPGQSLTPGQAGQNPGQSGLPQAPPQIPEIQQPQQQ